MPKWLIGIMERIQRKIWNVVGEFFDISNHPPSDETRFGLLLAVQDMYIEGQFEAQHILISHRISIRRTTDLTITVLVRSPSETVAQANKLKHLIHACEMANGAVPGSMEAQFMMGFINIHIANEETKPYENG
jgi:hypothetical protein